MNRRNLVFVLCTVIGIVLDQATKAWIVANVELYVGRITVIPGFIDIVHAKNPGAAFGMLGDFAYRHYVFVLFTIIAAIVIVDMFRKLPENDWFMSSALGLILSGAAGNAIDRVLHQEVTDFVRVYIDALSFEWPSFNVADAALVVGVGMLVVHYTFFDDSRKSGDGGDPKPPEHDASPEPPGPSA